LGVGGLCAGLALDGAIAGDGGVFAGLCDGGAASADAAEVEA